MSLKIVGALFMAGLVAQSCAFVVKSLQEDGETFPGFSFERDETADHKKVSLSAVKGDLMYIPFVNPDGPMDFTQGDDTNTLCGLISLPVFGVTYEDMSASAGDDSINDLTAMGYLGTNKFNMTLTARWSGEECKTEIKVDLLQTLKVELLMESDSKVVEELTKPAVKSELEETMSEALNESVLDITPKLVAAFLGDAIGDSFCEKLKTATKENYPKISFLRAS